MPGRSGIIQALLDQPQPQFPGGGGRGGSYNPDYNLQVPMQAPVVPLPNELVNPPWRDEQLQMRQQDPNAFNQNRFPDESVFQPSDPTMQAPRGDRLDLPDFNNPIFDNPVEQLPAERLPDSSVFNPVSQDQVPLPPNDPRFTGYVPEPTPNFPTPPDRFQIADNSIPPVQTETEFTLPQQPQPPLQNPPFFLPQDSGYNLFGGADDFRGSPRGLDLPSRQSRLAGTGPYINDTFVRGRGRY